MRANSCCLTIYLSGLAYYTKRNNKKNLFDNIINFYFACEKSRTKNVYFKRKYKDGLTQNDFHETICMIRVI